MSKQPLPGGASPPQAPNPADGRPLKTPNTGSSDHKESGYPEEHSPRHGTGRRNSEPEATPDADASVSEDQMPTGRQAESRQRDEQQAYRRAR